MLEPALRLTLRLKLLLAIGAMLLVLGIAKASMAFDDFGEYLIYRVVFTACCVISIVPVVALSRWLRKRATTAWQPTLVVIVAACVFAMLCSIGALLAQNVFGHEAYLRNFEWGQVFNGAYFAWFLLAATSAVYFGLKQYETLQQERHHLFAANALAREAELRALRYQLQPHFLFNTLNAISTLVREGDARSATRMITRLADFLRATLEGNGAHEVTLEDEISLTLHYLEIEKIRFGTRLSIDVQVDADALQTRVPNLLLQPLVENAIRHGISPSTQGGKICIRVQRSANRLRIGITDNGVGLLSDDTAQCADTKIGIGLENTRARLDRLYPGDYRLEVTYPRDGGCMVGIELPCSAPDVSTGEMPQLESARKSPQLENV